MSTTTTPATDRQSAEAQMTPRRFARSLSVCVLALATCAALLVERPSAREVATPVAAAAVASSYSGRDPSVPQAVGDRDAVVEELPATF